MSSLWIFESGSSKTDAACIVDGKLSQQTTTSGFNPYQSKAENLRRLIEAFSSQASPNRADKVIHYCSGATAEKRPMLKAIWREAIGDSDINIYSDLEILGHIASKPSWVGIIGTGSNLGYYNGSAITRTISSLGWRIGDEGSSRDIAKAVLKRYARQQLSEESMKQITGIIGLSPSELHWAVQNDQALFRVVSDVATALPALSSLPDIHEVILSRLDAFIELLQSYITTDESLILTGSVAYAYKDYLRKRLASNIEAFHFIQFPIQEIIKQYVKPNQ